MKTILAKDKALAITVPNDAPLVASVAALEEGGFSVGVDSISVGAYVKRADAVAALHRIFEFFADPDQFRLEM